jgi:hypothetical protein
MTSTPSKRARAPKGDEPCRFRQELAALRQQEKPEGLELASELAKSKISQEIGYGLLYRQKQKRRPLPSRMLPPLP